MLPHKYHKSLSYTNLTGLSCQSVAYWDDSTTFLCSITYVRIKRISINTYEYNPVRWHVEWIAMIDIYSFNNMILQFLSDT